MKQYTACMNNAAVQWCGNRQIDLLSYKSYSELYKNANSLFLRLFVAYQYLNCFFFCVHPKGNMCGFIL